MKNHTALYALTLRVLPLVAFGLMTAPGWLSRSNAHEKDAGEIEVSALTPQEKVQWARAAKIPLVDAVRTALAQTPGQAIQVTLESLKGRLLYEIEVVTRDGTVVEVFVDPQSGKVIDAGGTK